MNLPSCSTGVSLIRLGGMAGGGRGPTTALVTGPVIWAKAIEQTIAVPRITPEITKSFDLIARIDLILSPQIAISPAEHRPPKARNPSRHRPDTCGVESR